MALLTTLAKNGNKSSMSDGVQREDLKMLIKVLSGVTAGDISVAKITATGDVLMSSGVVKMTGLPATDPVVAGQLWNSSGALKVSSGPSE